MKIFLHTIALEPARWIPQRVSQPLVDLLPRIAQAGFSEIEIYEPHLTERLVVPEIGRALSENGITPIILSSYLNMNPTEITDAQFSGKLDEMTARIEYYGFRKVRLFPGSRMNPTDREQIHFFKERLSQFLETVKDVEVLLETHDGTLADDPEVIAALVEELAHPRVGLLFQPTFFGDPAKTWHQFRVQRPFIRHVHLQNRNTDLSFTTMEEGVVPWPEFFAAMAGKIDATLEFVPAGICEPAAFDLEKTLGQARAEADYAGTLMSGT